MHLIIMPKKQSWPPVISKREQERREKFRQRLSRDLDNTSLRVQRAEKEKKNMKFRPPLSGEWNDLAPPARSMGTTSLASRWEPSVLPENVLNTISQARAPSSPPGVLLAAQTQRYVTCC